MIDPPRGLSTELVDESQKAGIKTVYDYSDHKRLQQAIARDIGISKEGDIALTVKN